MTSSEAVVPPVEREELERLRTLHGRSTAAWVGDGRLEFGDGHWLALSGAMSPDYNLALCHGAEGAAHLPRVIETIVGARRPAIIAVAGDAARNAGAVFAEARWVTVGSAPLMVTELSDTTRDPDVHALEPDELPAARALVEEVFDLTPEVAEVALTVDAGRIPGRSIWGLVEDGVLVSALVAMDVDDAMVVWSMATSPVGRRRGYGRRLLGTALGAAYDRGRRIGLLHASSDGEPFYLSMGYRIVERWEFWSRSRWVLRS